MKRHRHDEETMEATAAHGLTRTRNLSVLESAHGSLVSMDVNASGFWAKKTWDWAAFTPAADGLVMFSLTPSEDPESGSHVKWNAIEAFEDEAFSYWLSDVLLMKPDTLLVTRSEPHSPCYHCLHHLEPPRESACSCRSDRLHPRVSFIIHLHQYALI